MIPNAPGGETELGQHGRREVKVSRHCLPRPMMAPKNVSVSNNRIEEIVPRHASTDFLMLGVARLLASTQKFAVSTSPKIIFMTS